jgi:serine/threonine-protein kinase
MLLKILDFGISKTPAELSELTGTQTVIGTPTYMAPEQMRTARHTDPRSDIWSMGVVMYQMLAGRPPFEAETYAELVLKVGTEPPAPLHAPMPPGLDGIVMRCLEKDPKNRIQSVGELARMLAPYASDPLSAQQSAERATRILTQPRNSNMSLSSVSVGSGGMGLTPAPALTPKSWSRTGGSSLGGAAGQIGTKVTRGGRGWVIAGVATLIVAAGAGGFVVATSMGKSDTTHVGAPNPLEATTDKGSAAAAPAPAPVEMPATPPPAPPVAKPDTANAAGASAAAAPKTDTKAGAKTETKSPKAEAKTETKSPKTETKSTAKSTKSKKPKGDDDLFDDRH